MDKNTIVICRMRGRIEVVYSAQKNLRVLVVDDIEEAGEPDELYHGMYIFEASPVVPFAKMDKDVVKAVEEYEGVDPL